MKNDDELSFSYSFPLLQDGFGRPLFLCKEKVPAERSKPGLSLRIGTTSQNIEEGHNIALNGGFYMRNIIISSARPCANPCAKKGEKRIHNLGTFVERYTRKPL